MYKYIAFISDISNVKRSCENFSLIQFILNLIPVLKWLPKYSLKRDLPGDISAGITVAVMHIPQGKRTVLNFIKIVHKNQLIVCVLI